MLEEDKGEDLKAWEKENQVTLGRVGGLLRMVWRRVRELDLERELNGEEEDGVRLSLVCESDGRGRGGCGVKAALYLRKGRRDKGRLVPVEV